MTCNCTGQCRKPPYTCSGKSEPDFLTPEQRQAHYDAYRRGETNFSEPFEPWVIRSWAKRLDEIGGFSIADRFRKNLLKNSAIVNDSSLTTKQKQQMLIKLQKKSKYKKLDKSKDN